MRVPFNFCRRLCVLTAGLLCLGVGVARAWIWDVDLDHVDDRIQRVERLGPSSAHRNEDPSQPLAILLNPASAPITYDIFVKYTQMPTSADVATLGTTGATLTWRPRYISYLQARASYEQIQAIVALAGVERVEAVEMLYATNDNATRTLRARDASGGVGTGLFPSVWKDLGVTGKGVVVAILDTGVNDDVFNAYPGHESLRGKFVGGGNFSNPDASLNTPVDSSENPRHTADPEATYHGTHVAGTAIGSGGPNGVLNGAAPGFYAGMAPDARLADCKVLTDAGAGSGSAQALEWCIAHKDTYWGVPNADAVYRGVQVVNMSLGGSSASDGTDANSAAVNAAVKAGIVVCVATGNDGKTSYMPSPAAADLDIAVGAFQDANTLQHSDDIVASFSNEGPRTSDGDTDRFDEMKPSVLGSGSDIMSASGDPASDGRQYHNINGTSMSCPTIAGLCALVLQANPNLSPLQVRDILQNTAEHRTDHGKQAANASDPFQLDPNYHPSWGWGLADAYAAVKEALNSQTTQVVAEGTSGVTVIAGHPQIGITWVTQREIGVRRFNVWRAPDVSGRPGTFAVASPDVPWKGSRVIERTTNRTSYAWTDTDPSLVAGNPYWYQVRWTDLPGQEHREPVFRVATDVKPVRARVNWSISHNALDNDITARFGSGTEVLYAAFLRPTGGTGAADSVKVVVPAGFGGSVKQYWFHADLTDDDFVGSYLPPSAANPWFLSAAEAGYVNTEGIVDSFSVTVYNGPSSTTYRALNPPTLTAENTTTVFWIPSNPALAINHAPVMEPIGNRTVCEGLPMNLQVHASDADGQALTYTTTGLPVGATFNAGTHTFAWTPGYGQAGSYQVRFQVTDTQLAADSEAVQITVVARAPGSNSAPVLTPVTDKTVHATSPLTFAVAASDKEGGALTYSATPLPAGASLNPGTGVFSWTPGTGQDGTYPMSLHVMDAQGAADSQAVLVTVTPGAYRLSGPGGCIPDTTVFSGTIGVGVNGSPADVKTHSFAVPANIGAIQGILSWLGGPAVDLDLYLLDPNNNNATASASLDDPEIVTYNAPISGTYTWKIVAYTNPNAALAYTMTSIRCTNTATAVDPGLGGIRFALSQNEPNPFSRASVIRFALPRSTPLQLAIYDLAGRRVCTLVNGTLESGYHQRVWDGRNDAGAQAASGVYFYRLESSLGTRSHKMILLH